MKVEESRDRCSRIRSRAGYWSIKSFRKLAADSEVSILLKTRERERLHGTPFPQNLRPFFLNGGARKNPFHACKQNDFEGRINPLLILSSWLVKANVVRKKRKASSFHSERSDKRRTSPSVH
uniref:Orf121 n=1 Tax=Batis maritima TaxID=4436 RepID=A0A068BBL9_BATMA|nr:orf121 [Batis maritima]AIC83325.1 orf121 [Batis maritima]